MSRTHRRVMFSRLLAAEVLLGLVASPAVAKQPAANPGMARADEAGGWSSRRVVVRFHPTALRGAMSLGAAGQIAQRRVEPRAMGRAFQALCSRWGVVNLRPLYPHAFRRPKLAARYALDRTYLVEVPVGTDTPTLARELRACGAVIEAAGVDAVGSVAQFIPNDAKFALQYGLHNEGQTGGATDADIDAPEAWDIHTGKPGTVTIAFVDSGVDVHVEFAGRLVPGINTNDAITPDLTTDGFGHGTHVASVAAAAGNNGVDVAGVSWGANIMPVRFTNDSGLGSATAAAEGVIWAADNGADIVNMSFAFFSLHLDVASEAALESAINYAHDSGVLLIAAAGNENPLVGEGVGAPARFANSMAVSATDDADRLADFSKFGPEVDVAAPGDQIWTTAANPLSGTSFAAPAVSGLAALIKSLSPRLTNDTIRDILTSSSEDLGDPGRDDFFGFGRINAFDALVAACAAEPIVASMPPPRAIDARQPSQPDGSEPDGWSSVDLELLCEPLAALAAAEFSVTQHSVGGGVDPGPDVTEVSMTGPTELRVTLAESIAPGMWTHIVHQTSGIDLCLGFLPGDVDGNRVSDAAADAAALIDCMNLGECDDRRANIDRAGPANVLDLSRLVDVFNGAGALDWWLGVELGPSPCD